MSDLRTDQKYYDLISQDLTARIRQLEQLPPRVQALELSLAEIRSDFRDVRAEQREAHKETREALKKIATSHAEVMEGFGAKISSLSHKVTFAAGAAWVVLGIAGAAVAFRQELLKALSVLIGAPQ